MTPVRLVIVAMVLTALVAGAAMYYLQVYAFTRRSAPRRPAACS